MAGGRAERDSVPMTSSLISIAHAEAVQSQRLRLRKPRR
jgi:hypothetical protein